MKFRDTALDTFLEELRCNRDIAETSRSITKIETSYNKRTNAALILYNAINYLWPYDVEADNRDEEELLNSAFNEVKNEISKHSNGYGIASKAEINDLIDFGETKYIVIDCITINDSKYLFLINRELDNQDAAIVKKVDNNYEIIKEGEEFRLALYNIILDFKEDILKLI